MEMGKRKPNENGMEEVEIKPPYKWSPNEGVTLGRIDARPVTPVWSLSPLLISSASKSPVQQPVTMGNSSHLHTNFS